MDRFFWDVWTIVQPLVTLFVATAGPALVGWLAVRLVKLIGIEDDLARQRIEAQLREALHHAAHNAMLMAFERLGARAPVDELLREAESYVYRANPETLDRLDVGSHMLRDILLGKLPAARTLFGAIER